MKTFSSIALVVLSLMQAAIITTGYIGQKGQEKRELDHRNRKECREKRFAYMQVHHPND